MFCWWAVIKLVSNTPNSYLKLKWKSLSWEWNIFKVREFKHTELSEAQKVGSKTALLRRLGAFSVSAAITSVLYSAVIPRWRMAAGFGSQLKPHTTQDLCSTFWSPNLRWEVTFFIDISPVQLFLWASLGLLSSTCCFAWQNFIWMCCSGTRALTFLLTNPQSSQKSWEGK